VPGADELPPEKNGQNNEKTIARKRRHPQVDDSNPSRQLLEYH
jgi:hypothetical protein